MEKPDVNGRLELHDASATSGDLPVGLSKANGTVVFNGDTATIQTLTGEAGGGKVILTGFVTRGDSLRFAVRVNASGVRVRVQQGVSVAATADIRLNGSTDSSRASGHVTIDRLDLSAANGYRIDPQRTGPAVEPEDDPSSLLHNMASSISPSNRTCPQARRFRRLWQRIFKSLPTCGYGGTRRSPESPVSIQLSQGKLAFLGSTYQLSSGTISFYNPNKVEPLLDITLKTEAKGVAVVLSVTGPMDNLKLTYTSDPPLQFQEIVALLASGQTPTSDPTLLANQPADPPQTFEQRGESAIVGKALRRPCHESAATGVWSEPIKGRSHLH